MWRRRWSRSEIDKESTGSWFMIRTNWFKKVLLDSLIRIKKSTVLFLDSMFRINDWKRLFLESLVRIFDSKFCFLIHLFESTIKKVVSRFESVNRKDCFLIPWFESILRKKLFLDSLIRNNFSIILILGWFFQTETVKLNHLFRTNCSFANLWSRLFE